MLKSLSKKYVLVLMVVTSLVFISSQITRAQRYRLIVDTDKDVYIPGELINITIVAFYDSKPLEGGIVGIELRDPNNRPVMLQVRRTDVNGVAQVLIKIGEKWPLGKYTVWVALSGTTVKATTSFFIAEAGEFGRVIIVYDANGLPLTGAKIEVATLEGEEITEVMTGSDGAAVLKLTTGNYSIRVNWAGAVVYEGSLIVEFGKARYIIKCAVYTLKVTVVEAFTGRLLIKTPITLELPNGTEISTFTDEKGRATFRQLPKGAYKLIIGNKVVSIIVNENVEMKVEVEPSWLWLVPVVAIIIIVAIIYVYVSGRRK